VAVYGERFDLNTPPLTVCSVQTHALTHTFWACTDATACQRLVLTGTHGRPNGFAHSPNEANTTNRP
jgi:hypothetical protein